MNIALESASALVDQFEQLLDANSISVPRNRQTGADMLSLWQLLEKIGGATLQSSQLDQGHYAVALAAHDLAAKVMEVRTRSPGGGDGSNSDVSTNAQRREAWIPDHGDCNHGA